MKPGSGPDIQPIIAGGEYGSLNNTDDMPLALKDGKLYCKGADIYSKDTLDGQWHHVAVTSNGQHICLYLDGDLIARADTAFAILPGNIGSDDYKHTFSGMIDEVRIWEAELPENVLKEWKGTSIRSSHPFFTQLKGYYTFDDFDRDYALNIAGKGHQSYHIRNGRHDFYGKKPMAYTVENDNPFFVHFSGVQELFNAVVIHSEWDASDGEKDNQILKLRITVNGTEKPLCLNEVVVDLSGNTRLSDISNVHLYYTGNMPRSEVKKKIGESVPGPKLVFKMNPKEKSFLLPGTNYFLLTFDIDEQALSGNRLHASVTSFKLNNKHYHPEESSDYVPKLVIPDKRRNPYILSVLQWNIWHGGVHLGERGPERIIELIKATDADIITMQEGYGSQDTIAKTLGYHLQTKSSRDNLALFCRYPVERIGSDEPFKSNPARITLPSGGIILVNDCWLRYAYRPEYTCAYPNNGLDPAKWIEEDSQLPLIDIRNLLSKDVDPYLEGVDGIIIGGDFNSGSHLDWTEAAQKLHNGYGPVELPVSHYMYKQGYKDSYRELHPDETRYPGGTFAVIFGHLQHSRIDYIYYKGKLKPLFSKIIRTTPEIDDVWPSDHAAIVTLFDTD